MTLPPRTSSVSVLSVTVDFTQREAFSRVGGLGLASRSGPPSPPSYFFGWCSPEFPSGPRSGRRWRTTGLGRGEGLKRPESKAVSSVGEGRVYQTGHSSSPRQSPGDPKGNRYYKINVLESSVDLHRVISPGLLDPGLPEVPWQTGHERHEDSYPATGTTKGTVVQD